MLDMTETAERPYQPRYVAYAAAHGLSPDAMLVADAERFPGGRMTGFSLWISEQWSAWRALHGCRTMDVLTAEDHESFDFFISGATK